jgi:hypothetical protein
LLWAKSGIGERDYKYRLLISEDYKNWKVVYETGSKGFNGWQQFNISNGIKLRYIRIHGLNCFLNNHDRFHKPFCVVQMEAYDQKRIPAIDKKLITNNVNLDSIDDLDTEINSRLPIKRELNEIIKDFKVLEKRHSISFGDMKSKLASLSTDISTIEQGFDVIRGIILDPVEKRLSDSNKIGRVGIWLGLIGGVIGIISILLNIFFSL